VRHTRTAALAAALLAVEARRRWASHLADVQEAAPPDVVAGDGVRLHVEVDEAPGAALTVVFAHGLAARLEAFAAQREALRGRARLVLCDQHGHGRSGWGAYRRATVEQLGRDLGRVVDELAPTGPGVLVGHSMGGMAVLALAGQRPDLIGDRVVGVALLSTSANRLLSAVGVRAARALRRTHALVPVLWLLWLVAPVVELVEPFGRPAGRRWLRRKLFGREPVPPPLVDEMQAAWVRMSSSIAVVFYPALTWHERSDALPALRRVPCLVLAGSADRTIPVQHDLRIAEALGSAAQLVVVPVAGHMVNLTHPGLVADALHDLLDRVEARLGRPQAVTRRTRRRSGPGATRE
jgi:pimeloyl-ACP methyl ester carboxylesterase